MTHGTSSQMRQAIRALLSRDFAKSIVSGMGYYLHEQVVWRKQIHSDGTARIHPTASIRNANNIYIGRNSHINHHCCIWAGERSCIRLGDDLLMGPGVMMFAGNHGLDRHTPMTHQPRQEQDIIVGNDVWLGAGTVVTGGVHLADGIVVAAGAVVTKSVEESFAILGGIPARVIGTR